MTNVNRGWWFFF